MKHKSYVQIKEIIKIFREIDIHFPLRTIEVFLEVAQQEEGLTVSQVEHRLNMAQATASRNCRALTARKTPKTKGYDLCLFIRDPEDHRSNFLVLNEKGKALIERLEQATR